MRRLLAKFRRRWRRQHAAFMAAKDILRLSGILGAEMAAGWEIARLHATNAYVLFKRRVISFRKIEIMMTARYMQMSDTSSCSGYRFYPLLSEMPRNGEGGVQKQWSPLNPRPPSRSLALGWKSDAVIKLDDRFCTRPASGGSWRRGKYENEGLDLGCCHGGGGSKYPQRTLRTQSCKG